MSTIARGNAILVTGATGGIGFEIAAQAAAAGAIVGVHGSREETVAGAIVRLKALHPGATFIGAPGDFRQPGVVDAVVAKVAEGAGRLDALVHCAITGGPGAGGPFAETDPASYAVHAGYVLGIFQQLSFAVLPHLKGQGAGTIIGFASDAGRYAAARQTIIGAAFGGVMAFARNLAMELSRDNVRVHCISPSYVADTPVFARHPGRGLKAQARAGLGLPTPADIAPMVLFLCGPGATKITGQVISINGGLNA